MGYGSLCSNCQQTEALQNEAIKNREAQEKINAQNLALQRRALQEAEYARQEAEYNARQNAQWAAESNVSSDDAYNYGFNYISLNWSTGNNPHNLSITVGEDGRLWSNWTEPYQLGHLNQSFSSGISAGLGRYKAPGREFIEQMAYAAGNAISKEELPSESFSLGSNGTTIKGVEIDTQAYAIKLEKNINEKTGELTYKYIPPFNDEALNLIFSNGMRDGTAEMNTPELMSERLRVEVPKIQEEKRVKSGKRLISVIWFTSIFIVPILGWLAGWQLTSGWTCFLTMVLYVPLAAFINLVIYVAVFKDSEHNLWK